MDKNEFNDYLKNEHNLIEVLSLTEKLYLTILNYFCYNVCIVNDYQ